MKLTWDNATLKDRGLITTGFHLPYNPDLVSLARQMRKTQTEAEKKIWFELLRNFKFSVLRQRPIDNFIVDFYCPKLKLVIEIDGAPHFTSEGKSADKTKEEILEGYDLKIIRFTNHEVMDHFHHVCEIISTFSLHN